VGTAKPAARPAAVVRPRLVKAEWPVLPDWAVKKGVRAVVRLELVIDEQGRVVSARALTNPGPGLGALAVQASRGLRFTPARVGGKAIRAKIRYPLRFIRPSPGPDPRRPTPRKASGEGNEARGARAAPPATAHGAGAHPRAAVRAHPHRDARDHGKANTKTNGEAKTKATGGAGAKARTKGRPSAGAKTSGRPSGSVKAKAGAKARASANEHEHEHEHPKKEDTRGNRHKHIHEHEPPHPPGARTRPASPSYLTEVVERRPLTAASDQVVRDRDFLLFSRQTPSDLLLMVPQLHISQHSGSGKGHQIFLRGFDAEHGQDLYVGFDGVPLNEPSHVHGIGYTDLHFILPKLVKRIEVLKGPYDVRYGNFATAGSVNFQLKDRLARSYASVSGGSFDTLRGTLAFTPPFEGLDAVVAVQGFSTAGFTAFGRWRGIRSLARVGKRWERSQLTATLVAYASTWNAADAVPLRLVNAGAVGFYGGLDETDGGASQRQHLSLRYLHTGKQNTFRTTLYLVQRRSRIYTNYTYRLNHPDHGDQTEQGDQRWILGGRAEWERELKAGPVTLRWLAGGVVRSDWVDLSLWRTEKRERWDRGAEVQGNLLDVGAYARLEVIPARWVRLVAGLRYDHLWYDASGVQDLTRPSGAIEDDQPVEGDNGLNVYAPKASVIFSPLRTLDLFINFGTGFHALDMRDAVLNPDQDIPLAYAGEVGFRTRLWRRLDLAGSIWGVYLEQEIFFDPTLGHSVDTGSSRRLGGELEARLRVFDWLHLHLDGSYTDARLVSSGDPVPNSPRLLVRGGITVRKPFSSSVRFFDGSVLTAGARVRYIGQRDLAAGRKSKAATLVDLLVGYELRWFAVELSFDNLLDAQWRDAQYYYSSRATLAEPDTGRTGFHFTAGTPFAIRATLRVFLP